MGSIKNKIDYAVIISVNGANPNGDPLNGNRPRTTIDGLGEISDVCIKRKIRNRLQDMGEKIFVQSEDRCDDGCKSLKDRANGFVSEYSKNPDSFVDSVCKEWIDVRAFGQLFAYKGSNKNGGDGISIGIRGPVSIRPAFSVAPVNISSIQITKSVNSETSEKRGSDTMGMKHRVDHGLYVIYGSISPHLAKKTGFSDQDAEIFKQALRSLFENDSSSARPDGSMDVVKVYWWAHNCPSGQYSSAKVHDSLNVHVREDVSVPRNVSDYVIEVKKLDGLIPEEY